MTNKYIPAVKNLLRTFRLESSQSTDAMVYHCYKAQNGDALEVLQSDATITVSAPAGTYVFDTVGMRDQVGKHFGTNANELFQNTDKMLGRVLAETASAPAIVVNMSKLGQAVGLAFAKQNSKRLGHQGCKEVIREAMHTAYELPKSLDSAIGFASSWHPTGIHGDLKADYNYAQLVGENAGPSANFYWAHAIVAMTVNNKFSPEFLQDQAPAPTAAAQQGAQKGSVPSAPRMG